MAAHAQGLTDFLTVLVAEQSVFTSQDTLAQTERDVALQLVALYKAVGGGWEAAGSVSDRPAGDREAQGGATTTASASGGGS